MDLTYELYESVIFYGTSDVLVDATFNTYEGLSLMQSRDKKIIGGYVRVAGY